MNQIRRRILVLILLVFLLMVSACSGQAITTYPSNLTIEGTKYDVPVRTVILTANQNVTDLRFLSTDLESPGGKIFPADLIQATNIRSKIDNGTPEKVTVRFDLPGAPDSGSFAGELWFSSGNETSRVPVTVTVKDGWVVPLAVLVIGVLVSLLIFTYETKGKKRDELLKTLGVLKYHVDNDPDFNDPKTKDVNPFLKILRSGIDTIQKKIQVGEIEDAGKFLESTDKIWDKWNMLRSGWIEAIANYQKFNEHLKLNEQFIRTDTYCQAACKGKPNQFYDEMIGKLEDDFGHLPDVEKPDSFLDWIRAMSPKEARYQALFQKIRSLAVTCEDRDCPDCDLSARWNSFFDQKMSSDLDAFEKSLQELAEKIKACPKKKSAMEALAPKGLVPPVEKFEFIPRPGPVPSVEEQSAWANIRLWFYNVGSFLVTLVILVGIGFSQLYVANPVFGTIGDYATLALWGLLSGSFAEALVKKTGKTTFGITE